jgi:hypothetical protein
VEGDRRRYLRAIQEGGVRIRLSEKRNVGLDAMVTGLIEGGLAMAHADWWIIHPMQGSLVLNDCGYARITPAEELPIERGILFPLRSDAGLIVAPPTSDATQVYRAACTRSNLETMNLRTYGWADEFIFGHSQDAVSSVRAAARKSPKRSRPPDPRERQPGPP